MLRHPGIELVAVTSRTLAGKVLSAEFPRLRGIAPADDLAFSTPDAEQVHASGAQVAFLALPHGVSAEFAKPLLDLGIKVIDLSADFRLRSPDLYAEFYDHPHPHPELLAEAVYALPEVRADEIKTARLIACPGCYPTSILLPLIPLLKAALLSPAQPINISSMSGASGAGRNASIPLLFCEVNGSLRSYSVPTASPPQRSWPGTRPRRGSSRAPHLCPPFGPRPRGHLHHHLCAIGRRHCPRTNQRRLSKQPTQISPSSACSVAIKAPTPNTWSAPTSSTSAGPTTPSTRKSSS
jgi:N-acetyl-gamma-glutamylphosphate reductase